ncbi:MAG: 3D domain-containing protein [Polyangiaceae bacterium]|nr:3D domain-containing protein [Polyangiaceae bacterium]
MLDPLHAGAIRATLLLGALLLSCVETRGSAWMAEPLVPDDSDDRLLPESRPSRPASRRDIRGRAIGQRSVPRQPETQSGQDTPVAPPAAGRSLGIFHNTYYSFPDASEYSGKTTPIFNAQCHKIGDVPTDFHDVLCVQGSGRLSSRQTVSFAKRDCACARQCPRSGQRICYETLDPSHFPWGRGARGRPITPFHTVAIDSTLIPLGTTLYVPAYFGLPTPDGRVHDGCFVAEDRGLKVVGPRVDVYTGSEAATHDWNQRIPTAAGVEVFAEHPHCERTGGDANR